jgi:hypothetical protein
MMNQKGVIYIILSAILLYLYYRRRDIAIFVGFIVVVVGTLILGKGGDAREGFGFGGGKKGGGGIDKECAKMGFKPIKLDKDDLAGTLEQVIKGIEQVAVKQWPYDGKATEDEDKKKKQKELDAFVEIWMKEAKAIDKTKSDQADKFVMFSADIYEKKRYDELFKLKPEQIKNMISGGDVVLKLLEKISKSDEIDSNFKKQLKYLICLCKYWTNIYKEAQKATADEGGGDDGEDEKPKNKKKTKKKPVDEGEGEGEDEEDEKPKRKKKTKKKPADDDDE